MRYGPNRVRIAGALLLATVAAPLLAAPTDVVASRIQGFKALGAAFKSANDQLRSSSPQVNVIQTAAKQMQATSRQIPKWFPAGSGPNPGVKTRAKAEIWTQAAQFKSAANNFAVQTDAFLKAAGSGDTAAMKTQLRQLSGACSSCHRPFRVEN